MGENNMKKTNLMVIGFFDDEMRFHLISATTLMNIHEWVNSIIEIYDLSELDIVYVMANGNYVYKNGELFHMAIFQTNERVFSTSCVNFNYEIFE